MARLDELAQGIAQVLKTVPSPEPLPVDMMNETPAGAAVFVRAVIESCARIAAPIAKVAIDPVLGKALMGEHADAYEGIKIVADDGLSSRIEFFRFPRS